MGALNVNVSADCERLFRPTVTKEVKAGVSTFSLVNRHSGFTKLKFKLLSEESLAMQRNVHNT